MKVILAQLKNRSEGHQAAGLPSICSANAHVIRAVMRRYKQAGIPLPLLIESTANQVDQNGGYTGMTPVDFANFVYQLADEECFPKDALVLGGDHLGPLTWRTRPESEAMAMAADLVTAYVSAGFGKIHLDTSMKLGDDPVGPLDIRTVARRAATLALACEKAFAARRQQCPGDQHPVYVVGSEVPVPGGSQAAEDLAVTCPDDFERTFSSIRNAFMQYGAKEAIPYIVAVVVQPGVEFSNMSVHDYLSEKAAALTSRLGKYPSLVFEGHSTDYQTRGALAQLVRDGVAVLKVGPGLTFAMREALMALEAMEGTRGEDDSKQACFSAQLEEVMRESPKHWQNYWDASAAWGQRGQMLFGYSDRCRYYLGHPKVQQSIQALLAHSKPYPLPLLSMYMPAQYARVRKSELENAPEALMYDKIGEVVDDYLFAATGKS